MDHLGALGREASAFYGAAATHLHLAVRSCPHWDVGDLVYHVGRVHQFWGLVAEGVEDAEAARAIEAAQPPSAADLVPWAEHQTDRLLGVLQRLDPEAKRWNWSPAPDVGAWIPRRMAHETAVHRWDLQDAIGEADPIDADLAADGVDEYLRVFVPADDGYEGPEGVLRLEAADAGVAWTVRLGPPHPTVVDDGEDAQEVLRLGASDLLLGLWGRVEVEGELVQALIEHTDRE